MGKIIWLYYHDVSTTSRPILLLAADEGITLTLECVDLFTGANLLPNFTAINPNQQVPMLDDDGFLLTESSAILKYLADKTGSSTYPKELKERARVNELMDWFNTGFYRDFGYHFIYPQILPKFKRKDPNAQAENLLGGEKNQTIGLIFSTATLSEPMLFYVVLKSA